MSKKWLIAVLVVLFFEGVFIKAGFWQLSRADEKIAFAKELEKRQHLPPVLADELVTNDQSQLAFLPVNATGQWRPSQGVHWLSQQHQGAHGRVVFMPFQTKERLYLVEMGFVAKGAPIALPPAEQDTITGHLYCHKGNYFAPAPVSNKWPLEVLDVSPEKISSFFEQKLFPCYIRLDLTHPKVLQYRPIEVKGGPHKHYGYAFQWFSFALGLLVMSAIFYRKRKQR